MGLNMAKNLQKYLGSLHTEAPFHTSLYVHNRTQSKADPLIKEGATLAPSVAGALSDDIHFQHECLKDEKFQASILRQIPNHLLFLE